MSLSALSPGRAKRPFRLSLDLMRDQRGAADVGREAFPVGRSVVINAPPRGRLEARAALDCPAFALTFAKSIAEGR
jgi:hypothetical protein